MSFDPIPFDLGAAFLQWVIVLAIVLLVSVVTITLTSFAALGATGPLVVLQETRDGVFDWLGTSFRRVLALAVLTFREAVRRKALLVFVVFSVLFLFAGWFISDSNSDPNMQVKVYVSFVLRTISWLILPLVLLLSCYGLPEDIRARSLHTVVTKPVRRHEVVLGRILGFSMVGTLVLTIMGVVGYVWIRRELPERVQSNLVARVPVYGRLTFLDRTGNPGDKGVNVGDVWDYRSYIEGNTNARAVWDFEGLDVEDLKQKFGETFPIETSFQAFRTNKGNIEKGILGQLIFVNEDKKLRAPYAPFEVKEFRVDVHQINPKLTDESGKPVNLYDDIIQGGKLRVEVRCLSGQQFLGTARPDLFIRLPDRTFAASYAKGVVGIGLMMVMIIAMGVTASTFAKGPVAMLLTAFVLFIGRTGRSFLEEITAPEAIGAGMLDALYRMPTHINPMIPIEESAPLKVMHGIDFVIINALWAIKHLFPDFKYFEMTEYVANGFDVPWSAAMLPSLALTVGYLVPWILVAYYSLKLRELESK